ncbi:pilus assembly protein TadG-related protein [Tabrizicola soli]|uniref:Pilus assembly protein TadG-related protein n=1 Tax=Tabrizicola soli TaxID=2185115 RepID=A0ABV7DTK8_9RHOB|nr:pilus assembly protein TadG-related protein [Tabrizicola soli]
MARCLLKLSDFAASDEGSITTGGLILVVTFMALGGLAVDVSNMVNQRTQLQVAADAAAHAALYDRNPLGATPEDAIASGVLMGESNMPDRIFGDVVTPEDIQFGIWNAATRSFTPEPTSRSAIRVETHRDEAGGNEIATFLLKFAGFDSWNVRTVSVFETYDPPCLREGFVAENMVDIQSNNSYFKGFCIHSNDVVSINSNNYFEAGTIVSMPDSDRLDIPKSGYKTNEGLQEALRYGAIQIRLINALREVSPSPFSTGSAEMWEYIQLATRDGQLDYVTGQPRQVTIVNGAPKKSDPDANQIEANKTLVDKDGVSVLRQNAVNYLYCSSTSTQLQIKQVLSNVVLITNCQVSFGSGGALEDGLIATLHTGAASISGSSDTRIGKVDNCADGGGAAIVSLGGMDFAAGVAIHGSQLIALKEIAFAANGEGLKGTSIISGDTVSGTSNMEMGLCGTGMGRILSMDYFRMVL